MADFSWAPDELRALLRYKNGKLSIGCSEPGCNALRSTAGKSAILRKIETGRTSSLLNCREHGAVGGKFSPEQIATWPKGHKQCKTCREVKEFSEFHKHSQALFGYAVECKACRIPASKEAWSVQTFEQTMLASSRFRAKKQGIPHTITLEDIVIPEVCPVLGVPIVLERNHPYRPSLDQVNPRKGYTPDNIQVLSMRANHLKLNMTLEEAKLLVKFLSK